MKNKSVFAFAFLLVLFAGALLAQQATQQVATDLTAATKVVNINTAIATQSSASATPASGNYVYIRAIDMAFCQDATGVASTNVSWNFTAGIVPSGNIPIWPVSMALTVNACLFKVVTFNPPLKSISPGTAVTLQTPASSTHTAYQANIYWYEAN